jgi:DNA-binding transcriptional LysR family regulator
LVARRLGSLRLVAAASPAYLETRGTPRRPEDLAHHSLLMYANVANPRLWRMADKAGREYEVRVNGPLSTNSGDLVIAAAIAGMGVVFEPQFAVQPAIDAGLLKRVLPGFDARPGEIWAVYPSRRHLSAKVRLFIEHFAEMFGKL